MLEFRILADENIPNSVIKNLKKRNYKISSIKEIEKGMNDEDIIKLSQKNQKIILTMDKDFGYLTYHQKMHPYGVILIRVHPQSPEIIFSTISNVLELINSQNIDLKEKFIVSDGKTFRIRKF